MKLSTRCRYGIHAMADLAQHYGEGPQNLHEIAERQQVPEQFLEQIIGALRREGFVEIKGVTLFDDEGMAYFPDAPTQRGAKHLHELIRAREEGYEAGVCFILQREGVTGLRPNDRTDPAFGDALREAFAAGVLLTAAVCHVTPEGFAITHRVPVWPERSVAP